MFVLMIFATIFKIAEAFDQDFVSSEYFVDKTDLLKEFFNEKRDTKYPNNYIACPAGFGKTTNLRTIQKFSEIEFDKTGNPIHWKDTQTLKLFEKLKVSREGSMVRKHLARHPVLFFELNFDFDRDTKHDRIVTSLNSKLLHSFKKYMPVLRKYLMKLDKTSRSSTFETFLDHVNELRLRKEDMPIFLHDLCEALFNHFNRSVVILVDEFDYLINEGSSSLEVLNLVYESLYKMFSQPFKTLSGNIYGMMAGSTTIAFRHYRFVEFSLLHYFSESNPFTTYFGFLENELAQLYDNYRCDQDEKHYVSLYYAGYRTVDGQILRFNSYSISEYLRQKGRTALKFPPLQYGGPFRQTFIPSFLKDPLYLDKIGKLMKNCPIRDLFKHKYDHKAVKSFGSFIKHDFGNTELPFRNILYTFTIEQGFFAPIAENTYVIPNYDIRARFITYLRYNYEQRLRIDLKLIAHYIREILQSPKDQPEDLNRGLTLALNSAFEKFRPFKETGSTLEFTHQLVVHIAALSYEGLQVIEDFPSSRPYNNTKFNPNKRCVTVATLGDAAAVIKITYNLPLQEALLRASSYSYRQEGINRVKYIAVDIPYRNFTRIFMATLNATDENLKT